MDDIEITDKGKALSDRDVGVVRGMCLATADFHRMTKDTRTASHVLGAAGIDESLAVRCGVDEYDLAEIRGAFGR